MKRINEIFYSLQGEGCHTGIPSVFVRFSGCNLKCSFCDTNHKPFREMSDEEIAAEIMNYPQAPWIILTGGEPSLQIDEDFIAMLKERTGKMIAIETNGTTPLPSGIDWITVSPKTGIEQWDECLWSGSFPASAEPTHPASVSPLPMASELKVVDLGQPLEPYFTSPWVGPDTLFYLQPCHTSSPEETSANTARTVSRVLADPRWRLSLQTHLLLNIP